MGALLANRAKKKSLEAAQSARAHDEEFGISRGSNEGGCRRPLDDGFLDNDVGVVTQSLVDGLVEQRLGRVVYPVEVRSDGVFGLVVGGNRGNRPRVYDTQPCLSQPRLGDRESQGCPRAL